MQKVSLFLCFILATLTLNPANTQQSTLISMTDLLPDNFFKPIVFTKTGLQDFLITVFNDKRYSEQVLPFDFHHLMQFLVEGKRNNIDLSFLVSSLRLFCNKLKESGYVSAENVAFHLPQFAAIFRDYSLIPSHETTRNYARVTLKNILYSHFSDKFSCFQNDPQTFMNDLSEALYDAFNTNAHLNNIAKEELRQTFLRFLDIALVKTIWSPFDQGYCWESVKTIAYHIAELEEARIINLDEVDDLFKTLIASFCRFLDLAGSELSLEVVLSIKKDIEERNSLLFTLPEQEQCLETKAQRLQRALLETEAKIHARMQGIITDRFVIAA